MRMELALHQRQIQTLRLAPQLLQKVEILQLTNMELENRIQQEMDENPTLEIQDPTPEQQAEKEDPREKEKEKEFEKEFERLESMQDEWSENYIQNHIPKRFDGERDKKLEALENTASRPNTLQDHLFEQIRMRQISPRLHELCEYMIYNIDNKGYLQFDYEELQDMLPYEVAEEEFDEALTIVQSLDPPGVGGRDLQECLLLQLKPSHPDYQFLKTLLMFHLEDFKRNKLPHIAKKLDRPIDEIKLARQSISQLNPMPGSIFSIEETHIVIPDVIVELIEGTYQVRVEDSYVPTLRISRQYRDMFHTKRKDPKVRQFIKKKLESAKLLIESIEQRQMTLYNVASEMIIRQKQFLDHGLGHLMPLKMQEVADVVGIHVSTVSRAINKKYIQTPRGIFAMKYFFTGGLSTRTGDESQETVKMRVSAVIEKEDKNSPLSDDEIAKILKDQGVDIARRTVSKYRKALNIPSSRQRREY